MSEQGTDGGVDALAAMLDLDHPRKKRAERWAGEHVRPAVGGAFDRGFWSVAAEAGIQGMLMPEAYGGTGCSAVEAMLVLEGMGKGSADNGIVFALASQVVAMQRALLGFGSEAQLERYLRPLVAGDLVGAFSLTEAGTGSDIGAVATTATLQADGSFVLTGGKTWATLAPVCDVMIIFATTDPAQGRWGLTAFLVDAATEGVTLGPALDKMGLAGCPVGAVTFDQVRLGPEAVLGRPGSGAAVFAHSVDAERAFLYASQLGSTERLLDLAVERVRTRQASGRNIGSFQAVSHRIVDLKLRHEAARLLLYKTAALFDRGEPVTLAAALAKIQTAEQSVSAALDTLRVFGAEGYDTVTGVEIELRDAIGGLFYSGTTDIARNIVAGSLRLDRPRRPGHRPPPITHPPDSSSESERSHP